MPSRPNRGAGLIHLACTSNQDSSRSLTAVSVVPLHAEGGGRQGIGGAGIGVGEGTRGWNALTAVGVSSHCIGGEHGAQRGGGRV